MQKLKNVDLNRIGAESFRAAVKTPLVLVLDNVRSALNVGSVFRTADAFLVEKIYLCGITATPPHRDILKTALGATETVVWEYAEKTTEAVDKLKQKGYKIFAVEQAVESLSLLLFEVKLKDNIALIFGHEVNGIDPSVLNLCDGCIEIPQYGTKHSLNISVCAGIVIWDIFAKMNALKK